MLAGASLGPAPVYTVAEAGTGRLVVCRPAASGTLRLVFTNSLYGGAVVEAYVPGGEDGVLLRTGVRTERAAAAEYYAYDGRVAVVDGWHEVEVTPMPIPAVVVRVDRIGDHRLRIDGEQIRLLSLVPDRTAVRLATERMTLAERIVRRC
jgi:hypothetical protein